MRRFCEAKIKRRPTKKWAAHDLSSLFWISGPAQNRATSPGLAKPYCRRASANNWKRFYRILFFFFWKTTSTSLSWIMICSSLGHSLLVHNVDGRGCLFHRDVFRVGRCRSLPGELAELSVVAPIPFGAEVKPSAKIVFKNRTPQLLNTKLSFFILFCVGEVNFLTNLYQNVHCHVGNEFDILRL